MSACHHCRVVPDDEDAQSLAEVTHDLVLILAKVLVLAKVYFSEDVSLGGPLLLSVLVLLLFIVFCEIVNCICSNVQMYLSVLH